MKIRLIISLVFFISSIQLFARTIPSTAIDSTKTDSVKANLTEKDTTSNDTTLMANQEVLILWSQKNAIGMNLSEVAFVNWNSGGNNSISALFHGNFERKYQKRLTSWKNIASIKIGLNAQQGREFRKTDDEIRFDSTFGYRRDSTSNFRYSAKFNFNTQFANGYKYPNTDRPISKFMAPGYTFLGVGSEYTDPKEDLTVYVSPVTEKSTFVLDQRLANEGMFGVDPAVKDDQGNIIKEGKMVRSEFGFLVTSSFEKEIFENINLDNKVSFYSDYLHKFGNIDVDWQLNLNLTVNDYVKANIGSHFIYDDDVKVKEDINGDGTLETLGPKVQLKQMLGLGVIYEF